MAVTGPPPEGPALRALARVHAELRARWPRPSFDGLYVTWDDLKRDPSHVGPRPRSHEGHFEADSSRTPDPVTWCAPARYGVACPDPTPSDLQIRTDDLRLATWSVSNLDEYWRPWRTRASRLTSPSGLFSASPYATVWGVTDVSRLHYTLATGNICPKEAACRYALAAFPDRWRRVVREAPRIRRSDYAGPSIGSEIAAQGRDFVSLWKSDEDRSLFWSQLERRRELLAFIDMVVDAGRHLHERRLASGGYGDG